ncbi:MAG: fibronectin type III domain-containing protein, partial [Ruminococcus sp.]|nr:fibronectin type III domain-containing protein [Ruminococcus sp.]
MKRNIFCVLTSLILLLSLLGVMPALTANADVYGDYEYSVLDDGTVEIVKYNENDTDVEIPKEIDGKVVSSIKDFAIGYLNENKIDGFKIRCYTGSAGEKYAKDNGFDYEQIDHVHSYTATVVPATYEAAGYTLHKCSCGASYKDNIKPKLTVPTVTGFKVAAISAQAVKVVCNKVNGATGYVFYRAISGKWVRVGVTKSPAFYEGKLKSGTSYRYAVKAYKTVGGKNYYSVSYPTLWTSTKPAVVSFKLTRTATDVTASWAKVTGATGYKVYYKTSANGKWVGLTTTKNTSYKKTGLKPATTYYFTVKAYRVANGVTYNGDFNQLAIKTFSKAQYKLSKMTLEEKVGQLFLVTPEQLDTAHSNIKSINKNIANAIKKYNVGGVIMFANNIGTPSGITAFNKDLQKYSKTKLFIAVDEEGGSVARIANNQNFNVTHYSSMQAIGNTKKSANAQNAGKAIGTYLKKYGFNLDFAPVADVNTNPNNIVIGARAFGSNPTLVSNMVKAMITGFHSAKVMTCIKHFPGHGDTKGDTHNGYVAVNKTWEQLKKCELIPFVNNLKTTDMVMVAHITANKVTNDKLPASLSKAMITGKLRSELKYNGVVITDALAMGAISKNYKSGYASVKAIQAGADIVLMP